MITIDIAQLHSRREPHPGPSFRRNDNDRRPARVVLRPNDSPGDWEERLRRAEAIRLAQESKSQRIARSDGPSRTSAELEALILAALSSEPRGIKAIAIDIGITENRTSIVTTAMAARGLITKDEIKVVRHGDPKCICTITALGAEALEGATR